MVYIQHSAKIKWEGKYWWDAIHTTIAVLQSLPTLYKYNYRILHGKKLVLFRNLLF